MNQLEGAIVGLGALKAMLPLEGNAAHIHGGLLLLRDGGGARIQILLNFFQIGSQFRGPILHVIQFAQNANGHIGFFVQSGITAGNHDHRNAGLGTQLIGIQRGIGADHNDLRIHVDDFFLKGNAVGAGDGQILELIEVDIIVQAAHAGLGLIVLHTHHQIGRAHIAAVAQSAHTNADDAFHRFGNFNLPIHAVHNDAGRRTGFRRDRKNHHGAQHRSHQ